MPRGRQTMNTQTLSRRNFSKLIGVTAAFATLRPELTIAKPPTTNIVRLSANENPYGPSASALKAMTDSFTLACRYPDEHAELLTDELARLHGIPMDQI